MRLLLGLAVIVAIFVLSPLRDGRADPPAMVDLRSASETLAAAAAGQGLAGTLLRAGLAGAPLPARPADAPRKPGLAAPGPHPAGH